MKKSIWIVLAAGVGLILLICMAGFIAVVGDPNATPSLPIASQTQTTSEPEQTKSPAAVAVTTSSPAPAKPKVWGAGMYKVGEDISAGSYKTSNPNDEWCYWERLKNDSGEFSAIIANDIVPGPGRMKIVATDKFVKFTGGCEWVKA